MDTSVAAHAAKTLPSATDSWMYLFSKFTHEAMLFEALAIFLGIFGYAVFYLIRKRKYGVAGKEVSSNLVKVYLGQLVADAEEMRTQLFGLLGKGEASAKFMAGLPFQTENLVHAPAGAAEAPSAGSGATAAGSPVPAAQIVQDPKLAEKLKELEKKLSEQTNALDSVLNEKMKLEEELANAKSEPKSGGGPDKSSALTERVKQLESQLAEYAIIEDDLANLKRLQKENKTLREQLAQQPAVTPGAKAPAPAPEAPKAAAPETPKAPEPAPAPSASVAAAPAEAPSDIAVEEVMSKDTAPAENATDFEALVDVVEKNLADVAKSENMEAKTEPAAPEFKLEPGAVAEQKSDEKSEEQLQADFEKMLNS